LDLRAQADPNTVIVGNLNIPLTYRSSRQKINKTTFRNTSHVRANGQNRHLQSISPNNQTVPILSAAYGIFSKIAHILGYKASLNKFKKIEMTSCIISDHNGIKLYLNNKRNQRYYPKIWRLNNTLLKDQWITEEIREEIKIS
jgi:hypothetical protein